MPNIQWTTVSCDWTEEDSIVTLVEVALDIDQLPNVPSGIGPTRAQRYDAVTFDLLGEQFAYQEIDYSTLEPAVAAWVLVIESS